MLLQIKHHENYRLILKEDVNGVHGAHDGNTRDTPTDTPTAPTDTRDHTIDPSGMVHTDNSPLALLPSTGVSP